VCNVQWPRVLVREVSAKSEFNRKVIIGSIPGYRQLVVAYDPVGKIAKKTV